MAIGIVEQKDFFAAFCFALHSLRLDREQLVALLNDKAAEAAAIVDRVAHGPDEYSARKIETWGSPVFYE